MTDPTDPAIAPIVAEYELLAERAASLGTPLGGLHPNRLAEAVKVEELQMTLGSVTRLSAARAVIRLKPDASDPRSVWLRATADFYTGVAEMLTFDAEGRGGYGGSGHLGSHDLYVARNDEHQYLRTAADLARLGVVALLMSRAGYAQAAQGLAMLIGKRQGDGPALFRHLGWPKLAPLLEDAPSLLDPLKTAETLTVGRWIAVAKRTHGNWWIDIFRYAGVDGTSRECFFRSHRGHEGFKLIPCLGDTIPAFPSLIEADMTIGKNVAMREPTKVFEVPDDVVEGLRAFVPVSFPISSHLDL